MSLKEELNPVEADNLNDVLAVTDVDLFADVKEREEQFEATIAENHRLDYIVFRFVRVSFKTATKNS
jgi:hypothetical protein